MNIAIAIFGPRNRFVTIIEAAARLVKCINRTEEVVKEFSDIQHATTMMLQELHPSYTISSIRLPLRKTVPRLSRLFYIRIFSERPANAHGVSKHNALREEGRRLGSN